MAYDAAFPHLFQPLANQRVLVGVELDIVGDRLVDEIAARTVLRGGQRIESVDLLGDGTETDGFLCAHNAKTITCIIMYYKTGSQALGVSRFGHRRTPPSKRSLDGHPALLPAPIPTPSRFAASVIA